VNPRATRIGGFVFAAMFTFLGLWGLVQGESFQGWFYLVLAVGWLLIGIFKPRFASREAAWLNRQRSRVEGFGSKSFLPDRDD
jgi:hypothetical protein